MSLRIRKLIPLQPVLHGADQPTVGVLVSAADLVIVSPGWSGVGQGAGVVFTVSSASLESGSRVRSSTSTSNCVKL